MLGIGMPGPFEWIIILVMLALAVGVVWLLIRAVRPPPSGPRGFDVDTRKSNRTE
jgi:hypothetical protein